MSDGDLQREMAQLAERLARIERRLGIAPEVPGTPIEPAAVKPIAAQPHEPSVKGDAFGRLFHADQKLETAPASAANAPPANAPIDSRRLEPVILPLKPAPPVAQTPTEPRADSPAVEASDDQEVLVDFDVFAESAKSASPTATSTPVRAPAASLEVLIGGKWMAWVGALVVILAAGFAVKVGIDQGWWGRVPAVWRCLGIAGFGGALLVAGEIALRRIGKPAAAGLISAGLGTLYLDAYAASRVFGLMSVEGAFILMAIVALGGFALTIRTRFLSIGVLSIMGGYLTPILLRGDSQHDLALLLFLSMLLTVSLALAGFMRSPFGALRFVALGCHLLIAAAWIMTNPARWPLAMFFMSAWWTMILVESVFTAIRGRAAAGNVIITLVSTAAFVTGGCLLLRSGSFASAEWMGAFTAMVAVVVCVAVLQFGSGLDALRGRTRLPIDLLSVALWLQVGVLAATAIALQFQGFGQAIGWLAMGVASIEMGRRLPSHGVSVFGIIVGGLATFRVCAMPGLTMFGATPGIEQTLFGVAGFAVSRWAILAFINIIALHVAASRLPQTPAWRRARIEITAVAALMWMGLCMHQADGLIVTAGWLAYAVVLLGLRRFEFASTARYLDTALVVLAAAAGRWLVIDALAHRIDRAWSAGASVPFLNWQMGLAVAIAGVGWWACRALAEREREHAQGGASEVEAASAWGSMLWQVAIIAGLVFGLVAISFEIDRSVVRSAVRHAAGAFSATHVRQLLFTLAWAIGSVVLALISRTLAGGGGSGGAGVTRTWLVRRFAWSLLSICAMKWIIFDVPMLATMHRALFDAAMPLMNLQMIVGVALAGALILMGAIIGSPRDDQSLAMRSAHPLLDVPWGLRSWMPALAGMMVLWGLTFEVDRLLVRLSPLPTWLAAFPPLHLRALLWTLLWLVGACAIFAIGRGRRLAAMFGSGVVVAALSAIVWLTFDTLAWRISDAPVAVTPLLNLQFAVGVACAVALGVMAMIVRGLSAEAVNDDSSAPAAIAPRLLARLLFALVGAIGLWLGSIEIDRIFSGANQAMSKQAGLSVWWAVYAVGLVVLGFGRRIAAVRYAGLALLSLTVVKVLLIDFSRLDSLPRVMSFAGAGLLLILTSVVYAKLSPVLLREKDEAESASAREG